MEKTVPFNCLHCSQVVAVAAYRVVRTFPGIPGGQGSYPPYIPGGGPGPYIPGGIPGTIPGTAPGVPAQLTQGNLPTAA